MKRQIKRELGARFRRGHSRYVGYIEHKQEDFVEVAEAVPQRFSSAGLGMGSIQPVMIGCTVCGPDYTLKQFLRNRKSYVGESASHRIRMQNLRAERAAEQARRDSLAEDVEIARSLLGQRVQVSVPR